MFPMVVPDPHVTEIVLSEQDEFLIIANKRFVKTFFRKFSKILLANANQAKPSAISLAVGYSNKNAITEAYFL